MKQNRNLYPLSPFRKRMHDLLVQEVKEQMRAKALAAVWSSVSSGDGPKDAAELLRMALDRGLPVKIEISPHRMVPAGAG